MTVTNMMMMMRPWAVLLLVSAASAFVAPPATMTRPQHATTNHVDSTSLFSSTMDTATTTTESSTLSAALRSTLQKPSKTLSILLEYSTSDNNDDDDQDEGALATLSMQLRKVKATGLVTRNLNVARIFAEEQATAVGNFPGPCPVMYDATSNAGDAMMDNVQAAVQAGVSAILLDAPSAASHEETLLQQDIDVIVSVNAAQDVGLAPGTTGAFLVNGNSNDESDDDDTNLQDIISAIQEKNGQAIIIAQLTAMQQDNGEITRGKQLHQEHSRSAGLCSILLREAAVGDGEDLEYATFTIDGLTKKRSSTFNMSGLTGSTNGHFGGVASTQSTTWLRQQR